MRMVASGQGPKISTARILAISLILCAGACRMTIISDEHLERYEEKAERAAVAAEEIAQAHKDMAEVVKRLEKKANEVLDRILSYIPKVPEEK